MRNKYSLTRSAMVAVCALSVLAVTQLAVTLPVDAAPAKKAGIRHTVAADRLSQQEALMLLNQYRSTVKARYDQMMGLYDYKPSLTTLGEAFDQGGVNPTVKERYLSAWAQNSLYLTWDVTQRFYKSHLERLNTSIAAMKKRPSIARSEMATLTEGMTTWSMHEENIARRFNDQVATFVRMAVLRQSLDTVQQERHQLRSQLSAIPSDRYLSAKSQMQPQFDQIDQREKALEEEFQQWVQRKESTNRWLCDMGNHTRVFVALFAPDRTQLADAPNDLPFTPVRMDIARPMPMAYGSVAPYKTSSVRNTTTQWMTNWGDMTLTIKGNKVTGSYPHDKGRLVGVLSPDGKTITAQWSEFPSYKGPKDAGKAVFTLSPDGSQFTGKWGYGNSLSQGDWNGTRLQK